MTDLGARVTPIRGERQPVNPDRPLVQPKPNAVNKPLIVVFAGLIVLAGGVLLYSQLSKPEAESSIVQRERGGRITGSNTRMTTGLNTGEGRMTASLVDDASAAPVASSGDAALKARIADLEAALMEASEQNPEIGNLIKEAASNAERIAKLEVALTTERTARSDESAEFERRLSTQSDHLTRAHNDALEKLNSEHQVALAQAEGRLITAQEEAAARIAALMDDRAEASRNARVRSRSIIVNRSQGGDHDKPYDLPVVPSDPAISLAQGATFDARLLDDVNVALPGSVMAIVASDIRSAAGSNILIPRGSTLRGGYTAVSRSGETRVVVAWNDLTLPDGSAKRLTAGPRNETALITTLWPNNPASLNREAEVTVLVAREIALAN